MRPFPSLHVFLNATPLRLSCGSFRRPSAVVTSDNGESRLLHCPAFYDRATADALLEEIRLYPELAFTHYEIDGEMFQSPRRMMW